MARVIYARAILYSVKVVSFCVIFAVRGTLFCVKVYQFNEGGRDYE
jgi:hypothetical protein